MVASDREPRPVGELADEGAAKPQGVRGSLRMSGVAGRLDPWGREGIGVNARKWVAVLAVGCGVALAVGIPVVAVTAWPRTETVDGSIVWVRAGTLLVHDTGGTASLRGHDVLIRLPADGVTLRAGEHIQAQISQRSHEAHRITLDR
jgi:hypothetical protein